MELGSVLLLIVRATLNGVGLCPDTPEMGTRSVCSTSHTRFKKNIHSTFWTLNTFEFLEILLVNKTRTTKYCNLL